MQGHRRYGRIGFLALCVLAGPVLGASAADGDQMILGWLEDIVIAPEHGLVITAKLDTGADTSSLGARIIKRFRRGDGRFVRFSVENPEDGESVVLVRPYSRRVLIRTPSGRQERRVVVEMPVCVGGVQLEIEVSLTDRSALSQPMLIGRSALEGFALIDPQLTFTTPAHCPPAEDDA